MFVPFLKNHEVDLNLLPGSSGHARCVKFTVDSFNDFGNVPTDGSDRRDITIMRSLHAFLKEDTKICIILVVTLTE